MLGRSSLIMVHCFLRRIHLNNRSLSEVKRVYSFAWGPRLSSAFLATSSFISRLSVLPFAGTETR